MRKILTSRIFRIWMLLIWVLMLFSGSKSTNGFSWFGLRTQTKNEAISKNIYVPNETMTDVIIDILVTHNKIAEGLHVVGIKSTSSNAETNSVPGFLSASQHLLYTDVLTYLENAWDKETALDEFSSQLDYYQTLGSNFTIDLQNTIQEQTSLYNSCWSQKSLADTMFYQGLNGGDEQEMIQWLADSETSGVCQTKARIAMNANKAMLSRVQKVQGTLTTLSSVLIQNRTTIIDNFQFFKDSNLEKLLAVRNQLRAASPGSATN